MILNVLKRAAQSVRFPPFERSTPARNSLTLSPNTIFARGCLHSRGPTGSRNSDPGVDASREPRNRGCTLPANTTSPSGKKVEKKRYPENRDERICDGCDESKSNSHWTELRKDVDREKRRSGKGKKWRRRRRKRRCWRW